MQSSQPSQCAAVDGMEGGVCTPNRQNVTHSARAFEEEGRKEEEEGREGKSRQWRSLELTSHNERERESWVNSMQQLITAAMHFWQD